MPRPGTIKFPDGNAKIFTMSKIFVDTNILIYAFQSTDRQLRKLARTRLKELEAPGQGVISSQVMQEFFAVATRKMGAEPLLVKTILKEFENFEVVSITPNLVYEAIDCSVTERISFWDSLIVVAAEKTNCA